MSWESKVYYSSLLILVAVSIHSYVSVKSFTDCPMKITDGRIAGLVSFSGFWRCHYQENESGFDCWHLWWANDCWTVQHGCWEAWWLSHWTELLSLVWHSFFDILGLVWSVPLQCLKMNNINLISCRLCGGNLIFGRYEFVWSLFIRIQSVFSL